MIFKKIVSSLVVFALTLQATSPIFAMLQEHERPLFSRNVQITPIVNLSDMEQNGVFIRPGDTIALDLDDTLIKEGRDGDIFWNLDPHASKMVASWEQLNASEANPDKHIHAIILTARSSKKRTSDSLGKIGFPDLDIVLAPNVLQDTQQRPTKGRSLIKHLKEKGLKPRRIIAYDDLDINLIDISRAFQEDPEYAQIPLKLFLRRTQRKIYESPESPTAFPETLKELGYVGHIPGNSRGIHVLEDIQSKTLFALKCVDYPNHMNEKILGGELSRAAGIQVPECAVYDHLPMSLIPSPESLKKLKALGIKIDEGSVSLDAFGVGPYLLSRFIEQEPPEDPKQKDPFLKRMGEHFVVNAFLRNFHGETGTVLGADRKLWQIGNESLRLGALKDSKSSSEKENSSFRKEFERMLDLRSLSDEVKIYGELTEEDLKAQIERLFHYQDAIFMTLDTVSSALHLDWPSEVREMLFLRLDSLRSLYEDYFLKGFCKKTLKINEGFVASSFASGVLIHSIHPATGKRVILVGDRTGDEGFSNLGGKKEEGDTLAKTATEEAQQESLGYMSFTELDLRRKSSSHTMVNQREVLYQMFFHEHPFKDPELMKNAPEVEEYEWKREYTGYQWLELERFLEEIKDLTSSKVERDATCRRVTKKTEETIVLSGNIMLYPPFWQMLQEPEVIRILEKLLAFGSKSISFPFNAHTYGRGVQRLVLPGISFEQKERELAEGVVIKSQALRHLKKSLLKKKGKEHPDDSETIQSMSGYLDPQTAQEMREGLRHLPSQTEAFLRHAMSPDVHRSAGDDLEEMVRTFLRSVQMTPYRIVTRSGEREHEQLEGDELILFLRDSKLYCKVRGKEPLEILPKEETSSFQSKTLRETSYKKIKDAVKENVIFQKNSEFQELLDFLHTIGYAPYLPPDDHYQAQIVQAIKAEKMHPEMAVFYHATDSFTSFLWDILRAYRVHLKIMGDLSSEVLRGWDNPFQSIQDVEGFIQKYLNTEGRIDNYAVVGGDSYPDAGLSVNPVLVGNKTSLGSCTFRYFHNSRSFEPVSHKNLFSVFMDKLGILAAWKDFYAIFQQYYPGNSGRHNSKLVQIFVDPEVVDTVAYTALPGGDILQIKSPPYHGFAKILQEMRANPALFSTCVDMQVDTTIQGRLFLNPRIFHNSKYVTTRTYWRYPLEETSYRAALDSLVMQTIQDSLLNPRPWDREAFFDKEHNLRTLHRLVYENQMGVAYKSQGEDFRAHFSQAVTRGNVDRIREIFEKHPEINLNEDFPSFSYRKHQDRRSSVPVFDLLRNETPNFSEIVRMLLERGATRISPWRDGISSHFELEDHQAKALNEFMACLDKLPGEISTWVKNSLKTLSLMFRDFVSSEDVLSLHKNGCSRVLSHISKEPKPLFLVGFMSLQEEKILATLLTQGTLRPEVLQTDEGRNTGIVSSSTLTFINCLLGFKEGDYQKTSWFKTLRTQLVADLRIENLDYQRHPHLLAFMLNILKTNTTLETLVTKSAQEMLFVLNILSESKEEDYKKIPWFQKEWERLLNAPNHYANEAYSSKMDAIGEEILKNARVEKLDLGRILKSRNSQEERAQLVHILGSNRHIKKLDLGLIFYDWLPEWLESLFLSLKSGVETLRLPDITSKEHQIKVVHILAKNKGLKEIKIGLKELYSFMDILLSDEEKASKSHEKEKVLEKAPWVQASWETLLKSPQTSFYTAFSRKCYALAMHLLDSSPGLFIDLYAETVPPEFLKELEILLKRNTPVQNSSLSLRGITLDSSWIPCLEALGSNTIFRSLDLEDCLVEPSVVSFLLGALEHNKTLEKIKVSKKFALEIMRHAFSKENVFRNTRWFEDIKEEFSFSEAICDLLDEETPVDWPFVSALFRSMTDRFLDVSLCRVFSNIKDTELPKFVDCLKENETLETLVLPFYEIEPSVIVRLMSASQGPFLKAPWFIAARSNAIRHPRGYIIQAMEIRNFEFLLNLFSQMTPGTPLASFLDSSTLSEFLKILGTNPLRTPPFPHLNLSNMKIKGSSISQLGECFSTNTTVEILDLTECFSDSDSLESLAAGFVKNTTLKEIKFRSRDRISFLNSFKEEDVPSLEALPWFQDAIRHILSQPEESIRTSVSLKANDFLHRIARDRILPSLDFFKMSISTWGHRETEAFMTGLTENETLQTLTIYINDFDNHSPDLVRIFFQKLKAPHVILKGTITPSYMAALEYLGGNTKITSLDLKCFFSSDLLEPFLLALHPNIEILECSDNCKSQIMSLPLDKKSRFEKSAWFIAANKPRY